MDFLRLHSMEVDGDDRRMGEDDPIQRDRILQDMAIRL